MKEEINSLPGAGIAIELPELEEAIGAGMMCRTMRIRSPKHNNQGFQKILETKFQLEAK